MGACSSNTANRTVEGAVKYYYFGREEGNNLKARGLAVLATLEVGGVSYEGKVVTFEAWSQKMSKADKDEMSPMGYLAVIELPDGTKICETTACVLTAGQLGGLNGKTVAESGVCYMLACKAAELFSELTSKGPTVMSVKSYDKARYEEYKKWEPGAKEYVKKFEKLCSAEGKFTSSGQTSGEIALWAFLHQAKACGFITFDASLPKLGKFFARMEALPGIAKVLKGESQMGQMLDYAAAIPDSVK